MLSIDAHKESNRGRKRRINEDWVDYRQPHDLEVLKTSGCLYVVADGVGGAADGEYASRHAVETIISEYYRFPDIDPGERLVQAIHQANDDIFDYAEREGKRVATTVVAAVVRGDLLTVAWVGDSRAYLIRNGSPHQITKDHTVANEMVRDGLLTSEEAKTSKSRNQLSRAVGADEDIPVDVTEEYTLIPGDKVLLCTDGLTKYSEDELIIRRDIAEVLTEGTSQENAIELINLANEKGGKDNISVIVISIGPPLNPNEPIPVMLRQKSKRYEDEGDTIRDVKKGKKPPAQVTRRVQDYVPLMIAGVAMFLVAIIVGIMLGKKLLEDEKPDATQLAAEVFMTQTASAQFTSSAVGDLLNNTDTTLSTAGTLTVVTSTPSMMPSEIPAQTLTATLPLGTPTPTPTPDETIKCVYQVIESSSLSEILSLFDINYEAEEHYYYYIKCEFDESGEELVCSSKQEIFDHDDIHLDWWILLTNRSGRECTNIEGGKLATTKN